MSNTNDSTSSSTKSNPKGEAPLESQTETGATKSKRWSFIQNDLEKALETWQELEKTQTRLSPEEEQFEKIKTIIGQLKNKIEQF